MEDIYLISVSNNSNIYAWIFLHFFTYYLLTQQVTVFLEDSSKYLICPKEEVRVIYPDKYKISGVPEEKMPIEPEDNDIPDEIAQLDDSEEIDQQKKTHRKQ